MHDQADELRQLVLRTAASSLSPDAPPPPLVIVCGGKEGVGSTTLAVNLAITLARQGHRSVLVDTEFGQPDATALCGLGDGDTLADVLTGRRTVHEVLQRGPAGIQLVPGTRIPEPRREGAPQGQQRLLSELGRLGPHADVVLMDLGSAPGPMSARFWQAADLVLLVTTDQSNSIMDAYAAVKILATPDAPTPIRVLVNQVLNDAVADGVFERIEQASRRFLGVPLRQSQPLHRSDDIADAGKTQRPFVLARPDGADAQRIELLAEQIRGDLNGFRRRDIREGRGQGRRAA